MCVRARACVLPGLVRLFLVFALLSFSFSCDSFGFQTGCLRMSLFGWQPPPPTPRLERQRQRMPPKLVCTVCVLLDIGFFAHGWVSGAVHGSENKTLSYCCTAVLLPSTAHVLSPQNRELIIAKAPVLTADLLLFQSAVWYSWYTASV